MFQVTCQPYYLPKFEFWQLCWFDTLSVCLSGCNITNALTCLHTIWHTDATWVSTDSCWFSNRSNKHTCQYVNFGKSAPLWLCFLCQVITHYIDVIMTTMASQITSLMVVYSTVYSGTDQRKYQSSASLAFVRTKGQLCGKCFHLMTSSWAVYFWIHNWVCVISISLDTLRPDIPSVSLCLCSASTCITIDHVLHLAVFSRMVRSTSRQLPVTSQQSGCGCHGTPGARCISAQLFVYSRPSGSLCWQLGVGLL